MQVKQMSKSYAEPARMMLAALSLWAVCLCWLGQVEAAGVTSAERLISEGMELRRAGKDAEGLQKFEAAYRLAPTPRAAAQWGLCLQAVGRWADADTRIAEALQAKADPWI